MLVIWHVVVMELPKRGRGLKRKVEDKGGGERT